MAVKAKLALDAMVFIYHFDHVEPYFTRTSQLLSKAQQGQYEIITSIISIIEILSPTIYSQKPEIMREINIFFTEASYLRVIDVNWTIAQEAAKLRRRYPSLRTPDAIQLATALISNSEIFYTNDLKLKKIQLPNLKIQIL